VLQKELYNGISNVTVWRVLRTRLHLRRTDYPSFKSNIWNTTAKLFLKRVTLRHLPRSVNRLDRQPGRHLPVALRVPTLLGALDFESFEPKHSRTNSVLSRVLSSSNEPTFRENNREWLLLPAAGILSRTMRNAFYNVVETHCTLKIVTAMSCTES
jgi:hypothetical protein